MITIEEALVEILKVSRCRSTESIDLNNCIGRILAEPIYADRDYPPFNRAAMDGFALRFDELSMFETFKVIEEIHAGHEAKEKIFPGSCASIMTGAPVPEEADTVIRMEDATYSSADETARFLYKDIKKGANISFKGEDITYQSSVIKEACIIDMGVMSTLSSLGKGKVEVFTVPDITVISTGTELKAVNEPVQFFQIRDSNSYCIQAFLENYKIKKQKKYLITDDYQLLKQKISESLLSDILIVSGGVSAGVADFIPKILLELGVKQIFHKVKIKPGKPLWFGQKENCTVFALPGNPYSVQVALKVFIEPFLRKGFSLPALKPICLPLAIPKKKKTLLDEFHPCRINENGKLEVKIFNGSGDISAILGTHGLLKLPAIITDFKMDDKVAFYSWKEFR